MSFSCIDSFGKLIAFSSVNSFNLKERQKTSKNFDSAPKIRTGGGFDAGRKSKIPCKPHDFAKHKKTYITLNEKSFGNVSTRGMMESESQLQDLACIEICLHVGHGSLRTECCGQNVHRENAYQPNHDPPTHSRNCHASETINTNNKQKTLQHTPNLPGILLKLSTQRLLSQIIH